jgi:hypothetical protein
MKGLVSSIEVEYCLLDRCRSHIRICHAKSKAAGMTPAISFSQQHTGLVKWRSGLVSSIAVSLVARLARYIEHPRDAARA